MRILNYIKTSLRTLFLHQGFSLLTLIGLSAGIAMSIFVLEFVFYQFSYDKHYDRSEDIYRVVTKGRLENDKVNAALAPIVLGTKLEQYPGVEARARVVDASEQPVQSDYAKSYESEIIYSDSTFFSVFSRPFLLGDPEKGLADSSGVVISRSAASRLFGNRNPIGEFIRVNEKDTFEVKAVFQDVPANSHFRYDFVLPFEVKENQFRDYFGDSYQQVTDSWFSLTCHLYFKVTPGTDVEVFSEKLHTDIKPLMDAEERNLFRDGELRTDLRYYFQELEDIYLFSDSDFEIGVTANPLYVFIFLGVAFFILMVTAFNFMNLTTSRALERVREAGVRRIFGANRRNLIIQFISESVLFSFMALFLGLVMVELLLPLFSSLFRMDFFDAGYREHLSLPWIILITFLVGIFSGSYPAFVFSWIKPVHLQRGKTRFSSNPGIWFRGLLVLIQVFVAVLVTTAAMGMWRQLDFVHEFDPGFNKENLVLVERARYLDDKTDSVMQQVSRIEGVSHVSKLFSNPGDAASVMSFSSSTDSSKIFMLSVYHVDCSVFETLETTMQTGHYNCQDSSNVLINEQAAMLLVRDTIEGKKLRVITHRPGNAPELNITGVVENIYFGSLKQPIRPAIYVPASKEDSPESLLVRVAPGSQSRVIREIREIWNNAGTGAPFLAGTMDEKMDSFYREDYRYSSLATSFSILIIIMASLGMTGLAFFLTATRKPDVLLRKITGIPDYNNIRALFASYFWFVIIGAVVALPVSQYLLNTWAGAFSIHYETDYLCFVAPFILLTAIASAIATYVGKCVLGRMSIHQF